MNDIILINVETVRFLRRILNLNGAQSMLNKAGFYFDLMPYVESQLKSNAPEQNSKGIIEYIKNNPVYFFKGDEIEVTKSINNYLMYDPKAFSLFGYPIFIYSDPAHLREYALYGIGVLGLYLLLRRKRK